MEDLKGLKPWELEAVSKMRVLFVEGGLSVDQVVEQCHMSRCTVRRWLVKYFLMSMQGGLLIGDIGRNGRIHFCRHFVKSWIRKVLFRMWRINFP